jgi:hypothetical protein
VSGNLHVDDGQLNALLDGELDAAEAQRVEAHVASCAECARRLKEARSFLTQAGELLDVLTPSPQATALPPKTRIEEVGLVAPLARGPGASGSTQKRDHTSEPATAKTAKEIAVDVDGRTSLTPAIRPVQPHEVPPKAPRRGWRIPELEKLAWAASLLLCVAVGYLAHEVMQLRGRTPELYGRAAPQQVAVAPPGAPAATANAQKAQSQPRRVPAAPTHASGRGTATARGPATKPRDVVASKPAPDFARQPAATAAQAPVAAPPSLLGAAAAENRASRSAALPRARAAAPAAEDLDHAAPGASGGGAGLADRVSPRSADAPTAPLTAFRQITFQEAVRRLSVPLRQIEGMQPVSVEAGPGRLVPGADPARDVIRVIYVDAGRAQFILDQQLADVQGGSFAGMMEGDTLVTTTASGNMRVRWMDRKFWLSLSGNASADSLRGLIAKVR